MGVSSRLVAMLVIASVCSLSTPAGAQPADPLPGYAVTLKGLEQSVAKLSKEFATVNAELGRRALQRRLIDLRIAFEMGNYQTTAILAYDVVSENGFERHRDYYPTLLILAESLFNLGNLRGATDYFNKVATSGSARLADTARGYLIDMALDADDKARLKQLIQQMRTRPEGKTRYSLAKAHFRLRQFPAAIGLLRAVPITSPNYHLAQYYLGASLTATGRLDQALTIFIALGNITAKTPKEESARDLANLAAGRLYMERKDTTKAVVSYQRIGRYSPSYDIALYEMAWSYIKTEDYKRAMRAADILLLVVQDEQLAVEAYVLRGRLSIMMDDYDAAVDSYERILARFAPIRNELRRFMQQPGNVDLYFEWLLKRHRDKINLTGPLSPKTAKWVASADKFNRIVKVFNQLSIETREIRETQELADELERVVSASNRVERFPGLNDGWLRALALQDALLALSTALLEFQYKQLSPRFDAKARQTVDAMRQNRISLENKWRRVPKTIEAYRQRKMAVAAGFSGLERRAFLIETGLKQVTEQLRALEAFLNKKQFADGGKKLAIERESEMRKAVDDERKRLANLYADLVKLKKQLSLDAKTVGTGDAVSKGEALLRASLIRAHRSEGSAYERFGTESTSSRSRQVSDMLGRIVAGIEVLAGTIVKIDDTVSRKVAVLVGIIEREKAKLAGYSTEMARYAKSGRVVARAVGEQLFEEARLRMKKVVLEADVGLIDVAWEQKQRKTKAVQELQRERSDRLQAVNDDASRLFKQSGATEADP